MWATTPEIPGGVVSVRRLGAATAALALIAGSSGGVSAGGGTSYHGVFNETPAGAADPLGYDIHGSAKMTIGVSGMVVSINVSGLDPDEDYGSHLHNGTCAAGGGGHYQNVEGGEIVPPNELWLVTSGKILESNPGGVAHATGITSWEARTAGSSTNARSVVVHEPGGTRIACADLD